MNFLNIFDKDVLLRGRRAAPPVTAARMDNALVYVTLSQEQVPVLRVLRSRMLQSRLNQ